MMEDQRHRTPVQVEFTVRSDLIATARREAAGRGEPVSSVVAEALGVYLGAVTPVPRVAAGLDRARLRLRLDPGLIDALHQRAASERVGARVVVEAALALALQGDRGVSWTLGHRPRV